MDRGVIEESLKTERVRPGELRATLDPTDLAWIPSDLVDDGARFVSEFASERDDGFAAHVVLDLGGDYLLLESPLEGEEFPSLTPAVPAANWPEREMRDLFGLEPVGHPNPSRLVVPEGWPADVYPMRKSFPREREVMLASPERIGPLVHEPVEGDGVFHIPYGPIRSGIFESAQFVVDTPGEKIIGLHLNMFFKHRGMEKLFENAPLSQTALVAERVSGTDSFAGSLAFCEAAERALGIEAPPRARYLRTILAELERIYNHLDHIARHCEAASLNVANARFAILKERVLRLDADFTGSRYLRGVNTVGGLRHDPDPSCMVLELSELEEEFRKEEGLLRRTDSFLDRLLTAAPLSREDAKLHAAVGPVARGSGIDLDCRRDRPYAAYPDLDVHVPTSSEGDADARLNVRIEEVYASFALIRHAAGHLRGGPVLVDTPKPEPGSSALGWAEGARGEELYYVRFGEDGRLERVKFRTASFANWPLFALTIEGQVLTDFAFMEHSFSLSQAGCDG